MARKVGQIIARGDRRWLIRVYLGRDHETHKRKYHNRTIHGPMREGQAYHSVVVVLYLNAEIRENQIASGCPRNDFLGFLDILYPPNFGYSRGN